MFSWQSQDVLEYLKNIEVKSSPENILKYSIESFKKDSARSFGSQISPAGKRWKPNLQGSTTLWGKGVLFEQTQMDSNYRISGDTMGIYNAHPGAGTHHWGLPVRIFGRTPPYKFPDRSFVGASEKGRKERATNIFENILGRKSYV